MNQSRGQSREGSTVPSRPHFWNLLAELGAEHDKQLAGLVALVRELRLELSKATDDGGSNCASLKQENLELKRQLMLPDVGRLATSSAEASPRQQEDIISANVASTNMQPPMQPKPKPFLAIADSKKESMDEGSPDNLKMSDNLNMQDDALSEMFGGEVEEDPQTSQGGGFRRNLARFVERPAVEGFVGFLILANTVVMMIEGQYVGLLAGYETGLADVQENPEHTWPNARKIFDIIELFFTAIFTVELIVRGFALGLGLFKKMLNWVDIFCVMVSLIQVAAKNVPINATIFRLIRVARLTRGLRFLRLGNALSSLKILIKCLRSSCSILFWSLCLLMVIQCVVGMVASQLAQEYIIDTSKPESKREELFKYYGTFTRSFITMFEIHMANWIRPCRVLMETLGEFWGSLFVFYRAIVGFAVMSVISAVFVQQTMSVVQNDNDIMILKKQKEATMFNNKLKQMFAALDQNEDGMLSRAEFDLVTRDEELKIWMSALDIEPDDLEGLFNLLDTGDGMVSMEEFLMGATRVRGNAKSIDMVHLLMGMGKLERSVHAMKEQAHSPNGEGTVSA